MKILIIGSKGFIGSHLYSYYSSENEVWGADVVDNNNEKRYFQIDKSNTSYEAIFREVDFDLCINASGNGSVPVSLTKPLFDFELNVLNTMKLLDAIRIYRPNCKFINMSSAAVYGNPAELPIKEDVSLRPLSPYGWHKLYAEQICKEYFYLYNVQTINLRLFSVYGENLRKQLFWGLYQKCKRSAHIELFGSGSETRDFIYIKDLLFAADCVVRNGLFNGESINIASGIETSISEAATIFCKSIDDKATLNFNHIVKQGDPLNWRADISLISDFGFQSQYSIEEGLINTAKWLKENA